MDIEKQIEEVMELVQSVAQQHRASFMGSAKENSAYRRGADIAKNEIRAKLRTLLSSAESGDQCSNRDTLFFLAGWNGCNEKKDAHEAFRAAHIAASQPNVEAA